MLNVFDDTVEARDGVDLEAHGELLALDLVAHGSNRLEARTDKGDANLVESVRKVAVFRKETVAYFIFFFF